MRKWANSTFILLPLVILTKFMLYSLLMKKKSAFSLIEMMIVLGIITMMIGLTTAYFFNFRSGAALKISANNIMAALNLARSLAITQQVEHGVAFDINDSAYRVFIKPDTGNPQFVTKQMKTLSGVVIESTNLPIDSNSTFSARVEVFNPTGNAENNGSIYLKNSEGKYYTITIVNATGRIRIYNYNH